MALFAHSLGPSVALHFLDTRPKGWKDEHVAAFFAVAPVWSGNVVSVNYAISGIVRFRTASCTALLGSSRQPTCGAFALVWWLCCWLTSTRFFFLFLTRPAELQRSLGQWVLVGANTNHPMVPARGAHKHPIKLLHVPPPWIWDRRRHVG